MTTTNEPKYRIENGKLVNRVSGEAIPDDEPIFVLRARDCNALDALYSYYERCGIREHRKAVLRRIEQFRQFAQANPARMKEPDTTITADWPG